LVDAYFQAEIADCISDALLGTKIQCIGGANVGTDVLSLSFSGKIEQDQGLISLPQGHRRNVFSPVRPPSSSKGKHKEVLSIRQQLGASPWDLRPAPIVTNFYYDVQGNPTESLRSVLKKMADRIGVPTRVFQKVGWGFRNFRLLGWLALPCPVYDLFVDGFSFYGTRAVS
jgi:hypothetical protein